MFLFAFPWASGVALPWEEAGAELIPPGNLSDYSHVDSQVMGLGG